jgi:hypothetical protein
MKMEELAEVDAASFFLYGVECIIRDKRDLLDKALAVDVAQLGKGRERVLAIDKADRQTVGIWLLRSGERDGEKRILVVLLQHNDGSSELAALSVGFVADVLP